MCLPGKTPALDSKKIRPKSELTLIMLFAGTQRFLSFLLQRCCCCAFIFLRNTWTKYKYHANCHDSNNWYYNDLFYIICIFLIIYQFCIKVAVVLDVCAPQYNQIFIQYRLRCCAINNCDQTKLFCIFIIPYVAIKNMNTKLLMRSEQPCG